MESTLKLTAKAPENGGPPWKFGDSYWKPQFLGCMLCMLVLRTVNILRFGGDEEHPNHPHEIIMMIFHLLQALGRSQCMRCCNL